jgi:citrate lyase alpha subunit
MEMGEYKMDYFKVFDSGHLYGVVRIIVVATAHEKMGRYIIETFAFSLYDQSIFKGKIIEYDFDASGIIEDEINLHVKNIIDSILTGQYKAKKDISLINQHPDCKEIERSILLSMKSRQLHIEKLEDISKNSNCDSLKEYLVGILALPSITIRDYK